jgi:hypothetical protein
MALTDAERQKRWYSDPQHKQKRSAYITEQRRVYRKLYLKGKIAYKDIPVSYRYFKDTVHNS